MEKKGCNMFIVSKRNGEKVDFNIQKIKDAIEEATDAGYVVSFYHTSFEEQADYRIDENDACLLDIELE